MSGKGNRRARRRRTCPAKRAAQRRQKRSRDSRRHRSRWSATTSPSECRGRSYAPRGRFR
ncbi:hypothetical protein DTO57_06415 [Microbacterium sorbitolivorans]|uniref:Uncharacterized protein n=1 Tax=Microbacterium sorbitolivorans TaxID=1867410 RepID=A0A367Y1P0_9MICO|nr:hypothetical protein DTO57_06415 [Microbacterium sorbitolivorans]